MSAASPPNYRTFRHNGKCSGQSRGLLLAKKELDACDSGR